jgi:hypothetical protein
MIRPRRLRASLALALAWSIPGLSTVAADQPAPRATVPSDPVFSAVLIDGTIESGRIRQVGPDAGVVLENDDKTQTIPWRRLFKLTREGPPSPFPPEGSMALFPGGDRLRAVIGTTGQTTLEARSYIIGDVAIPLDSLLGLVLAPPSDPEAFEVLLQRIREQKRSSEVLWLVNGDRQTGGFLGLGQRSVAFQPEGDAIDIDRSQVVALGFDPTLVAYPPPKGEHHELTLADGSRLGVTGLKIERGQVEAVTRFNLPIRLAIADLAQVHVRNETVVYLSERKPDGADYVPYVGPARPYRSDTSVDGHPLRLSGRPYDRGLGTQSRTLLAYKLGPADRRFQALVGLDDRAGPLGSVVFRVNIDGKDRYVSDPLSLRDTPRTIDVDVSGGKILILFTEFGERGEVRDFADWVEARLIR